MKASGILGMLGYASAGPSKRTALRKELKRSPFVAAQFTPERRKYHSRGYKGARVMGDFMGLVLRNGATSRKELLGGKPFYIPHQGAKERAKCAAKSGGKHDQQ